ncbi:HepT-like ribonuclease domain-containing protein [Burkholderia sp. MR1-5-21]
MHCPTHFVQPWWRRPSPYEREGTAPARLSRPHGRSNRSDRSICRPMDKAGFVANMLVIDAVIRNIEVIGDASNKVRKHHRAFADEHPEVPWRGCYEMRSVVAHDYFKVDLDIVWETIKNDLPGMRRDVQALLDRLVREQGAAAPSSQGTGD